MKEKLKIAGYAQRGVVPLALGVAVTMWLWNALIPEIVGWKAINHGQSLGLPTPEFFRSASVYCCGCSSGISDTSAAEVSAVRTCRAGSTAACTRL